MVVNGSKALDGGQRKVVRSPHGVIPLIVKPFRDSERA